MAKKKDDSQFLTKEEEEDLWCGMCNRRGECDDCEQLFVEAFTRKAMNFFGSPDDAKLVKRLTSEEKKIQTDKMDKAWEYLCSSKRKLLFEQQTEKAKKKTKQQTMGAFIVKSKTNKKTKGKQRDETKRERCNPVP